MEGGTLAPLYADSPAPAPEKAEPAEKAEQAEPAQRAGQQQDPPAQE